MLKNRLKLLRSEHKMSQRDLAKALNVSQQAIASWEVGRTSPDNTMLTILAQYFDVSIDYLLGRTPELKKGLLGDLGKGHNPQTVTMDWLTQLCLKTGNVRALDALTRISITETGDVRLVGVEDKMLERTLKLQIESLLSVLEIASDTAVINDGLVKAKWNPDEK